MTQSSFSDFFELWTANGWLLVLALTIFALAVGLLHWRFSRQLRFVLLALSSGLGFAWLSNNWILSVLFVLGWLLFPFIQILIVMRKLRVPTNRSLVSLLPCGPEFEPLRSISNEWEKLHFEVIEDCELKPGEPRQVFRFLLSKDKRYFVTVGWAGQGPVSITYSAISSWSKDGTHWLSWNYPLPYGLKTAPGLQLWTCPSAFHAESLLQQQIEFLRLNEVEPEPRPDLAETESARQIWGNWIQRQLDYNVSEGWLTPKSEGYEVGYSWRGVLGALKEVVQTLFGLRQSE